MPGTDTPRLFQGAFRQLNKFFVVISVNLYLTRGHYISVVGIDVGSETHYARAFDWRGYEYSAKAFQFSNTEAGFASFLTWMQFLRFECYNSF